VGWLHDLSTGWLALVVFAASYLVAAAIFVVVMALAKGRRAEAFKAVSSGLLPPMGLLFGLLVGFLAAQVWSNADRAQLAGGPRGERTQVGRPPHGRVPRGA
jgi:hypothetical protein